MMAHVDLCSGIGGFALGFEWAGLSKPVLFCDIEPWSRKVLAKHWPDVPIAEDVKELANDPDRFIPRTDPRNTILTAGYPCQPFSVAGKQRGTEDDRHIWPFISQIIAHKRPAWCVLENVYGHVALGLDEVLADLEAQDYATRAFIVPACAVDAPHRRDRLWIIAHANSHGEPDGTINEQRILGNSSSGRRSGNDRRRSGQELANRCEDVADTRGQRCEPSGASREVGSTQKKEGSGGNQSDVFSPSSRTSVADTNGEGLEGVKWPKPQGDRVRPSNCGEDVAHCNSAGLQGWQNARDTSQSRAQRDKQSARRSQRPDGQNWLPEPDVGRVANGVPKRVDRLKGLGNAIVPQIAMQIGLTIKAVRDE